MKHFFRRFRSGATFIAIASAVALAATAIPSCKDEGNRPTFDAAPTFDAKANANEIVIGIIQDLTGLDKTLGLPLANAARVAEHQLNALGGILGRRVRFEIVDDGSDLDTSEKYALNFIDGGAGAILGATTSGATVRVQQVAGRANMLVVSGSATTPALNYSSPIQNRYFFRTAPSGDLHGEVFGKFLLHGPPTDASAPRWCNNVALVYSLDSYGGYVQETAKTYFTRGGGKVSVAIETARDPKSNYNAEIKRVFDAGPDVDCIGVITYLPVAIQFLRDLRNDTSRDWSKVHIIAANTMYAPEFWIDGRIDPADPESPSVAQGVYGVSVDNSPDTPEFSFFRRMYFAQFPPGPGEKEPPRNTPNFYDACIVTALALENAGGYEDRAKLRDALYQVSVGGEPVTAENLAGAFAAARSGADIDYRGASGPIDFDEFGNVKSNFIEWKLTDGEFHTLRRVNGNSLESK